jgi:hypothetical protein
MINPQSLRVKGQSSLIDCGVLVASVGNGGVTYMESFTNGNLPVNSWEGRLWSAKKKDVKRLLHQAIFMMQATKPDAFTTR